jgi:hypothetical protein
MCKKHNKLFNTVLSKNNCKSRIISYYEKEEDAFKAEFDRINELKEIGQCSCNIYNGGFGGETKTWTKEKREWYSKNNCMKSETQRNRMSINNPMKNKDVANRVGVKHRKSVIIGDIEYESVKSAARAFTVSSELICFWLSKGCTNTGIICHYKGQEPAKKVYKGMTWCIPITIDGKYYESIKKACIELDVSYSAIITSLKNNKLLKNKYVCKYANHQPSSTNIDNSSTEGSTTNG